MALDQTELFTAPPGVDPAEWVREASRGDFWLAVVNISGCIALVLFCRVMVFYKRKPWTRRGEKGAAMDRVGEDEAREAVSADQVPRRDPQQRPAGAPAE